MKLGDKLEFIFKITGINYFVKWIYPNCNCKSRKEKLNEFKFNRK